MSADQQPFKDIFGTAEYEAPGPSTREFQPWHKPRKQFVRDKQWRKEIEELLAECDLNGEPLKYLGLPGDDLLDLRYFHATVCAKNDTKIRFLGFNNNVRPNADGQTAAEISLQEVKSLPSIHEQSEVIWDDFADISRESSTAYKKAFALAPYHIVNLDLCDGFGKHRPGKKHSNYDALHHLVSYQKFSKTPWLLFLTTRIDIDSIDDALIDNLSKKINSNLMSCRSFLETLRHEFLVDSEAELSRACADPRRVSPIFTIGLLKWIIARSYEYKFKCIVRSIYNYRVNPNSQDDDLSSIAIKFMPIIRVGVDPDGLASGTEDAGVECRLATNAAKRVSKRLPVDNYLLQNVQALKESTIVTKDLLEQSRYDTSDYDSWLTR